MNVSTLQDICIQSIYNSCLNCGNHLDTRDILVQVTTPLLQDISQFLSDRFWYEFSFAMHAIFLIYEEILQQRSFGPSPFLHNFILNSGFKTQREILKECLNFKIRDFFMRRHIFPKPIWYTFMTNIIRDKRKQRDIVIQFCNSLYEKTVLTIVKSTWNLKYAEIKQILYPFPKPILRDFKSIFPTLVVITISQENHVYVCVAIWMLLKPNIILC